MSTDRASWRPSASLEALRQRAAALRVVREFFAQRELLEVETPLLCAGNVPDEHVSGLIAAADQGLGAAVHLQTSPELSMKRLIAAHGVSCFQICKAFRREELGTKHNQEFTVVEWYRVGWSHEQLIEDVTALIAAVFAELRPSSPPPDVERHRYRRLLRQRAGIDPILGSDEAVVHAARTLGAPEVNRGEALDFLMACVVEPSLEVERIHVVDRYPADQAALARLSTDSDGDETAERFEVYFGPLELANGYGELTSPETHRERFTRDRERRRLRGLASAGDIDAFLEALEHGLPACSGVALGFDRLVMAALGYSRLDDVISFR